ncbi:MAG: ribonuclease R, partial [Candidatus Thiodiazotropha weberae]|nr:ribonuclease R [Candidatus Thiodiazotropha weberae]
VELEEIYVDGLVHITALDNDYYHYDPVGHRLTGERTGKVLRLGDPLTIIVAKVNLDDRKIDFVPAKPSLSEVESKPKPKRKRSKRKSKSSTSTSTSGKPDNSKKKSSKKKRRKSKSN